jgi:hypothetical protein
MLVEAQLGEHAVEAGIHDLGHGGIVMASLGSARFVSSRLRLE